MEPIYALIRDAVRQAKVAHADETSHYRGEERRWLWTLCIPTAVYFLTHYSRGKGAAKELLQDFEGIRQSVIDMAATMIIRSNGVSCAGRISTGTWNASRGDQAGRGS